MKPRRDEENERRGDTGEGKDKRNCERKMNVKVRDVIRLYTKGRR